MRGLRESFRGKLLAALLMVGIVPLVICVALMLNIFRIALARSAGDTASSQLEAMTGDMNELLASCGGVLERLGGSEVIIKALAQETKAGDREVYNALFDVCSPLLQSADFSLYGADGALLYTTASNAGAAALPVGWGVLYAARGGNGIVYRDAQSGACVQAAAALKLKGYVTGYAVADVTKRHFERLFEGKYSPDSDVLVLDQYWDEAYCSPTLQDDALASVLRQRLLSGQSLHQPGENYTYYVQKEQLSGFCLVLRQNKPVADWIMRLLYIVTSLSILLCLGLCVAVSMGISRQLFKPIRLLNSAMAAVEGGNLDARVDVTGVDELSQLAGRFNRMTQRLKENLAQSLGQQKELSDAKIRMMQAQLNPHFLYNTLDTLKWMGKIHKIPEIATISADLADILRSSISADEFVALGAELELLNRYVEIQKIRFSGKFEFKSDVHESLMDTPVPKLMLQPLVENAIIHGFEDGSGGVISVSAVQVGKNLVVTVADDGCGMTEESKKRFLDRSAPVSGHLGLYNVDAILRLHYGEEYGLKFPAPPGRGTCIRITLPAGKNGKSGKGGK